MLRLLIALFLVSPIAYAVTEIPCIDGLVPLEPAEIKAVTADDFIPVPEITADLTNPQEVRRLGAQMMNVLTENSRVTAQLFYGASKERDDSFKVLRGHLMRSGQDAGGADESLLGLFAKFNEIAATIGPPEEFTPTNAAKQTVPATRSMVRGLLSILPGRAREYIPPTIEQWLQIYANESPNFEKMAARVQIALDDIAKRRDLAMAELNRFDELVEIANKLTDSYRKMKTELEAQSAGLSPEEKERAEQMLIIPLAQEIDEINNLIGVHQTLIAQKQQIILQADPVIRVVSRASTAVIVGLRNAAITHEDAQALKQAIHGAENMRRVLDRSIESTSRIIDQTSIATDRMLATSTYSHDQYLKNARLLAATLKRSREETELLLPTLNARIAAYDETLKLTAPE